jgi:hypothetical protein
MVHSHLLVRAPAPEQEAAGSRYFVRHRQTQRKIGGRRGPILRFVMAAAAERHVGTGHHSKDEACVVCEYQVKMLFISNV